VVERAGERMGLRLSRIDLCTPILHIWVHWKTWSPNGSTCWPHGQNDVLVVA
jgi:hypothetical protein